MTRESAGAGRDAEVVAEEATAARSAAGTWRATARSASSRAWRSASISATRPSTSAPRPLSPPTSADPAPHRQLDGPGRRSRRGGRRAAAAGRRCSPITGPCARPWPSWAWSDSSGLLGGAARAPRSCPAARPGPAPSGSRRGSAARRASARVWPRWAMCQTSSTPVSSRSPISTQPVLERTRRHVARSPRRSGGAPARRRRRTCRHGSFDAERVDVRALGRRGGWRAPTRRRVAEQPGEQRRSGRRRATPDARPPRRWRGWPTAR